MTGIMNQSKADAAEAFFNSGFNCAQAVLAAYCEDFGLDPKTALKISGGLGAGMGRLQRTCGAVTGAFLAIGLKYGKCEEGDDRAKEKTYDLVREFAKRFEERHGTTSCRALLGIDLIKDTGRAASERTKSVCPRLVRDATEILDELLNMDTEA